MRERVGSILYLFVHTPNVETRKPVIRAAMVFECQTPPSRYTGSFCGGRALCYCLFTLLRRRAVAFPCSSINNHTASLGSCCGRPPNCWEVHANSKLHAKELTNGETESPSPLHHIFCMFSSAQNHVPQSVYPIRASDAIANLRPSSQRTPAPCNPCSHTRCKGRSCACP